MASIPDGRAVLAGLSHVAVALALGMVATMVALVASVYSWVVGAIVAAAIPIAALVVLRPRAGVVLFIFALATLEEFPGGLSEHMVERSARLPFYSTTFGLPAIYPPDAIIGCLLGLFLLRKLLWGEGYRMKLDMVGWSLILMTAAMTVSILLGLAGEQPLGPEVLDLSLLGAIKLPEAAARYIAVLQLKLFLLILPVYVLGLIYFRTERDLRDMGIAITCGMVASIGLGFMRILGDPSMVQRLIAVIYDTATVTLMALAVFYVVMKWSCDLYKHGETLPRAIYCIALALLIVLSFRRTLWGAIALSTAILPFIMPREGRGRLLALAVLGVMLVGGVVGSLPGGQALLTSIVARTEETNLNDPSTLYRFSLLVWVVERFGDLPVFGWGIKPLWNETIHIRFFSSNMENVHSLYFWVLVRFGIVGIAAFAVSLALILLKMVKVSRQLAAPEHKIILVLVFISILLYLFGGIFNPVYSSVRLVIFMGFALALISRLPDIAAARAAPPG